MLDHRAKQTVERVIGDEQVLKLIQAHDRQSTVGRVQAQGDVEKLEQRRTGLIRPGPGSTRSDRELDAGELCRDAEPGCPAPDAAAWIGREHAETLRHACGYVPDVGDLRQIDSNRSMTDGSHRGDMSVEKTGLPKAARGSEPDGHAVCGRALQDVELESAIDERARLDGTLVFEWVHRT